jgi:methylenetetrahydrofolate dehydrogenase (NADP+) / methenyltetrahydrofolate cyclohydrolase
MSLVIYDGITQSNDKEPALKQRVDILNSQNIFPKMAAILFKEDAGSQVYTQKKKELAERLGISYDVYEFSVQDGLDLVIQQIKKLNQDQNVTGIIIQKPWRKTWELGYGMLDLKFSEWWEKLMQAVDIKKDVDGLHPSNTKLMPATCRAVLEVGDGMWDVGFSKVVIIGRSDLLGKPLYKELKKLDIRVELFGKKDLESRMSDVGHLDADIIVTATGVENLIKGEMVKEGVVVIDAGEPKGDVEFESVSKKAKFITPVPGGVGPMTVVSLMENCLDLAESMV